MSPFGYNETIGQDFYPLSDEELVRRGWRWRWVKDYDEVEWSGYIPLEITQYDEKTVRKQVAQENIQKCLKQPIVCKTTGRPFRIQPRELAFYIEHSLPIPDRHPTARHQNRVTTLNHRGLHDRNCSLCNIGLMTTYSNDQPEKIVCEKCYRETVY